MKPAPSVDRVGRSKRARFALALGAILGLGLLLDATNADTWLRGLADKEETTNMLAASGPWAVVVLIALAVVATPIPSGPIALAAGALYGTLYGGCLTLAGAGLGALTAFGLSRRLAFRPLSVSSLRLAAWLTRPRSQRTLMLIVLGSRLVPFVSFDAVSYVSGLTRIETWRFALATFLGAAPISFALAAVGAGLRQEMNGPTLLLASGITLLLPALLLVLRDWRRLGRG